MIKRRPIIGVMGSHAKPWDKLTKPLGKMIAHHDYHLLTGAGGGVMTSVSKAFTDIDNRYGVSIGIVPTTEYDGSLVSREEFPNPYIELPIFTMLDLKAQGDKNPYSRNNVNIMTSHAIVVLPGDHGSRNEASLAIQYNKPMILFGPAEEFNKFPQMSTIAEDISEIEHFLETVTEKIRFD